ncbi:hypothetical protein BT96DRAFT_288949 [Gymnopus androsaceus JB14]|uniref:Fungal-type protein kinase domain-containing protein n=1 Tax=Gymnopus androsaceus JB14 TaxID=1447944 RepID=A0A6A4H1F5_9AGAR|nr:hypothetical protein BT96DRAFT_288949 [Gymnopus androsaceus JB14]
MVDNPIECAPFTIEDPNEIQTEILEVCRELGLLEKCCGFVVDGDMAIDWRPHYDEKHDVSNSGTPEFMSNALLEQDNGIIHSPMDDYWSFYFTAQWACVFRKSLSGKAKRDPRKLENLRSLLASLLRGIATKKILDEPSYGSFLTSLQPFLSDWNQALKVLLRDWQKERLEANPEEIFQADAFRRYADRGLLSFLKVARQYYPTKAV